MNKYCPIGFADGYRCCDTKCILYQNGCLIEKALNIYIKNNTPFIMKQPTEEEMNNMIAKLKEEMSKYPLEPMLFKHPELNIKHDYDEYGADWYPHGYDDIAP